MSSKDTNIKSADEQSSLQATAPETTVAGHYETKAEEHQESPEVLSRRKFLNKISIALGGVSGLLIGAPVVAYIVAPLFQPTPEVWRTVGAVTSFRVGETTQVSFADASPLAWSGVTAQTAAWLRRESEDKFIAFAVNCTHLGCPVSWIPGGKLFMCPCHGGVYYADGTVAAGPPPHSLARFDVRIVQTRVEIRASGIPLKGE